MCRAASNIELWTPEVRLNLFYISLPWAVRDALSSIPKGTCGELASPIGHFCKHDFPLAGCVRPETLSYVNMRKQMTTPG